MLVPFRSDDRLHRGRLPAEGRPALYIYARISYSLEIANPITITVYPVTYDHYENVLGRSLPPSFLPREPGTEYEACGKYTCIPLWV